MIPALNPLVLNLKESATLAVNIEARRLRDMNKEIYHFGFGQSPFPVPEILRRGLEEHSHKNHYLPTRGLPKLCEAVSSFYQKQFNYTFTPEDVFVGPGSKELIFQCIYLIEGPLLVPAPSWVSYGPQATLRGKLIKPIITQRNNSYKLTAEELDRACYSLGEGQKILILNNPGNPTGAVYTHDEMKDLAEICRAYHVVVISDEIYAMIDFNHQKQAGMSQYYPEGTIVSGGLSKSFSAGGYRLGVLLIPEELAILKQALKSIISETYSSVSAPVQYAAYAAYASFDELEEYISTCCDIHRFAGEYLHSRFLKMNLNCPRPGGAFYLFPDFENYRDVFRRQGISTGYTLCEKILQEARVALLPGADFYLPATNLGVRVASVDYDGAAVLKDWKGAQECTAEKTMEFFPNLVRGCDALEDFLKNSI
ncbi:pyridoxal phosphate-dependent aminotransferase [Chitinivibrio alkaliphilus]|uniref:Aminotransferase n=1 Tax=Chitinivibrio alkaliphilus ACht1 TaxID=1313304 RepID=U7DE66_9BACT|nr:pyridoxal phosphate-dependent aminotransferase [Chitinivibrio alkaliphilus]ERP39216.1 aspartate aminotransferase [Chitinivibrio alkaliphilus ACht1]